MKEKLKKLQSLFYIPLAALLFFSCNKDDDSASNNSNGTTKVEQKSFDELIKTEKFRRAMSLIPKKKGAKSSALDRTIMEDKYTFTIYDTPINVTENDTLIAYNLLIQSDTLKKGNYFENLVINIDKATNNTRAYIVKFNLTSEVIQTQHESFYFESQDPEIYEILYNNAPSTLSKSNTVCYTYHYVTCTNAGGGNGGGAEHIADEVCYKHINLLHHYTIESCTASEWEPNNFPGNGHMTQNSNGSYNGGGVVSTPASPIPLNIVVQFVASLTPEQLTWWNDPRNGFAKRDISKYLVRNTSWEKVEFANEAIVALMNGGKVNFDNEIILDISFENNPKAKCVFTQLLGSDIANKTHFKDIIVNLFDSNDTANIKFSIAPLPTGFQAATLPNSPYIFPGNSMYNIVLDATFVQNASNIEIALALLHELIHAELIQRLLELGIVTQVGFNSNYDAVFMFANGSQISSSDHIAMINALVQYYRNYSGPSQWNHDLMTSLNYVNTIAENLEAVYPLINDPNNDFLTNINNDPANTNGAFTLQQAMYYLSLRGFESTQVYINTIQNVPAELNKTNYIETASRTKFSATPNCN